MTQQQDAPLSDDARALLDALLAEETPDAQRQDEVWASVSRDTPPQRRLKKVATGSQPHTPAPKRTWMWVAAAVAVAAAAVLVLGNRDAQRAQRQRDDAPQTAPYQAEPSAVGGRAEDSNRKVRKVRTMAREVPAPVPPAEEMDEAADPVEPPPLQRPSTTRHRPGADARAEIESLRRAKQALAEGRAAEALKILEAPGRGRGRGQLGREREALRIEALCAVGRTEHAGKEAKILLERNPGHPYAKQLRRPCEK